ncbi:DUF418 domain-containing protein [Bacillus pumilus]|uniref:DUF418 domain-containing protein n=1 Tax=Bacillus pumilus TaxID=1408 RepID=UPI00203EF4BD|nr:DUF418 domain-containing protein [Bacillus pumilus]MCM3149863.1 DUF418 domain-containing protein [Bacillus pumilus]
MNKRIKSLDFIRGFAICGILLINIPAFVMVTEDMKLPEPTHIESMISSLINILVTKKFFGLFSILFGIGIGIFMDNCKSKGISPYRFMSRRLTFLLILGIIHMVAIFWGSILVPYALIGFIVMGLYGLSSSILKNISISIVSLYLVSVIIKSFHIEFMGLDFIVNDSILILNFFIIGLYMVKSRYIYSEDSIVSKINRNKYIFLSSVSIMIMVVIIYIAGTYQSKDNLDISLLAIPQTILYFLILQNISLKIKKTVFAFEMIGKMAFTNYVMQSIIGGILISVLGIVFPNSAQILYLALIIISINFICSYLILKYFKQGPLECIWRKLTYRTLKKS